VRPTPASIILEAGGAGIRHSQLQFRNSPLVVHTEHGCQIQPGARPLSAHEVGRHGLESFGLVAVWHQTEIMQRGMIGVVNRPRRCCIRLARVSTISARAGTVYPGLGSCGLRTGLNSIEVDENHSYLIFYGTSGCVHYSIKGTVRVLYSICSSRISACRNRSEGRAIESDAWPGASMSFLYTRTC